MSLFTKAKKALEFMSKDYIFDMNHYREAELTRLMNLFAHIDLERWRGLKILEVGAGIGHIGSVFISLGFDVTSTDGRAEYVEKMKQDGRKAFLLDLDKTGVDEVGDFDVVLSFGVLYHLTEPEKFLLSCGKKAKVLVLETSVCDSEEPVLNQITEGKGLRGRDQALNEFGCRPSPVWIEQKCRQAGFDVINDISNPIANWSIGKFDWEPVNSGLWKVGDVNYRKMWVFEKNQARS